MNSTVAPSYSSLKTIKTIHSHLLDRGACLKLKLLTNGIAREGFFKALMVDELIQAISNITTYSCAVSDIKFTY